MFKGIVVGFGIFLAMTPVAFYALLKKFCKPSDLSLERTNLVSECKDLSSKMTDNISLSSDLLVKCDDLLLEISILFLEIDDLLIQVKTLEEDKEAVSYRFKHSKGLLNMH